MMPPARLRRGIGLGLLALVALMPFHAFFSIWLGHLTGHQAIIQAWKELLLVALSALGIVLLIRDPEARDRLRTWPALLSGAFALVAVLVTLFTQPSFKAIAFGAKTDFEFLLAFILALMVANPKLVRTLIWTILISSSLVIGFGLLQSSVLPPDFLAQFGYNTGTIAPYLMLDPAVGSLRFSSTLGGPNQLGTFLLLPLALAGVLIVRRRQWWWIPLIIAGAIVLTNTYSRAAWAGAGVAVLTLALTLVPSRLRAAAAALFAGLGLIGAVAVNQLLKKGGDLQYYIFHSNSLWRGERGSDFQHLQSLRLGVASTLGQPFGHGLGTAGPAVLHSGTNGLVIENYYLQLSYESGILGGLLFLAVIIATGLELARRAVRHDLAAATLAALVGISVTSLVLPAWADSSTALIFWITAGSVIGLTPETRHV
jgi:hypothetical protein